MNILQHFPYKEIRPFQKEVLEILQTNWERYDVFCIVLPTAFGKTSVARSLMSAYPDSSYIVPTNLLVNQMIEAFPSTPTLRRLDSYWCEEWQRPCSVTRGRLKSFCKGCSCSKDLANAKYRRKEGVYNYHTYLAQRLHRSLLIIDEAHLMIPMLQELGEVVLWQHDYKYPSSMYRVEQIQQWVNALPPKKKATQKVAKLLEQVNSPFPEYSVSRSIREFNGKGTKRGEPEERDCLVLTPLAAKEKAPLVWSTDVKKTVLLSATIGPKDIESLGLDKKRVLYINSPSPIPHDNRPFVVQSLTSVSYQTLVPATEKIARYLLGVLLPRHEGERGLIHTTYQMAKILRPLLNDRRFIFHDKFNKQQQYEKYINTPGSVLIACGLYEGINLPDDLGRWQVITKIPWPSLGDPAIALMSKRDEEWYLWQTAKTVIQAAGRICRHEKDFGITYCLDSSFNRLYSSGQHLLPAWFKDCLRDGETT